MKQPSFTFLLVVLVCAATATAQKPVYPKPPGRSQAPIAKKLAPPLGAQQALQNQMAYNKSRGVPFTAYDSVAKQYKVHFPGRGAAETGRPPWAKKKETPKGHKKDNASFHLTKDLNFRMESDPSNYMTYRYPSQFAVRNNVSYFYADDGIHGRELWRSDATAAGTYMVKDINPGEASSGNFTNQLTVIDGKLYFRADTDGKGMDPWVSDGTAAGTYPLVDLNSFSYNSYGYTESPSQFVSVGNTVFFVVSSGYSSNSQLWKTDGTPAGTALVQDIANSTSSRDIMQSTAAGGLLFFTAFNWSSGYQLWRSDGTDAGTYIVKQFDYYSYPGAMQLTGYNNALFFSADDGTGRRLWTSDGTEAGTGYAPGNNGVFMQTAYIGNYNNYPFAILNNALYISGYTYGNGDGLYKYDASNNEGLVLVKDLTPGTDPMFIPPIDMTVVENKLYFKVIGAAGGYHDELWKTDGTTANTRPFKIFEPGINTYAFVAAYGGLYFGGYDPIHGSELWKSNGTAAGTKIVKDIWMGATSSAPYYFTPVNGKILMNAADAEKGASLYVSDGTAGGTYMLKDINTTTTGNSYAGRDYKSIAPLGDGAVFRAFEREFGWELYGSDGTSGGTGLLNDIRSGENSSFPNTLLSANGAVYFMAYTLTGGAIYKTDGTKGGLQKLVDLGNFYVISFNVTANGLLFYTLFNYNTYTYELWRSDGTPGGTFAVNGNLNYYNAYLAVAGNTVFFVAADYNTTGAELWKSDGTVAGTKLVKDISPGFNGSSPYSLFAYNNEVYFGAHDGTGFNYSFWKSDGTEQGTVKLKDITPASAYNDVELRKIYAVSKGILYLSASGFGYYSGELWKTDGTPSGTQVVKKINPYSFSYVYNLTDVDGVLFFTADDGVHGTELWSSNGTAKKTMLVEDITLGPQGSLLSDFSAVSKKLFFIKDPNSTESSLWVSGRVHTNDPHHDDTYEVDDPVVNGLTAFSNLTAAGDNLFFSAYNYKYGYELYVGHITNKPYFVKSSMEKGGDIAEAEQGFAISVSPNPAQAGAVLLLKGNTQPVSIQVADMTGRVVWQQRASNRTQVPLPVETLLPGVYVISAKQGTQIKTVQFVRK